MQRDEYRVFGISVDNSTRLYSQYLAALLTLLSALSIILFHPIRQFDKTLRSQHPAALTLLPAHYPIYTCNDIQRIYRTTI